MELTRAQPKRLFIRYLFTALGSTLITSVYSSVDLICVGHYCGPSGSAAVSCLNPLWSMMIGAGLLLGIGGSVWMGSLRGHGFFREGNEYFTLSLALSAAVSAGMMLLFQFGRGPLMTFFGADEEILPYAMEYTGWIVYSLPCFLVGEVLVCFIRNDGSPGLCTAAVLTGGVINAVCDIFFVFDFGLGMGMSGAGLATALGQTVAFLIMCTYFLRRRCRLRPAKITRAAKKLRHMLSAGFATFVIELSSGIMVALFNRQIIRYAGNVELAVFGVVSTVAIFIQSLFYGVGNAVQPIVSANFGAGLYGRVRQVLRYALVTACGMSLIFFTLTELFPTQILAIYMDAGPEVMDAGRGITRLYSVSFLFMGVNVLSAYYLQSILRAGQSVAVSLSRGLVLCSLFVMLLPLCFGFDSIWLTMPLSELLTMFFAVFLLRSSLKTFSAG